MKEIIAKRNTRRGAKLSTHNEKQNLKLIRKEKFSSLNISASDQS